MTMEENSRRVSDCVIYVDGLEPRLRSARLDAKGSVLQLGQASVCDLPSAVPSYKP